MKTRIQIYRENFCVKKLAKKIQTRFKRKNQLEATVMSAANELCMFA